MTLEESEQVLQFLDSLEFRHKGEPEYEMARANMREFVRQGRELASALADVATVAMLDAGLG